LSHKNAWVKVSCHVLVDRLLWFVSDHFVVSLGNVRAHKQKGVISLL
jgi:hypothetical protein